MFGVVEKYKAGMCLMHSQGLPENMQNKPHYENVLLDIYDYLKEKIAEAESTGISRKRIIIDPGIGFGKSFSQKMEIINYLPRYLKLIFIYIKKKFCYRSN